MRLSTKLNAFALPAVGLLAVWSASSIVAQAKFTGTNGGAGQTGEAKRSNQVARPPTIGTTLETVRVADAGMPGAVKTDPQAAFEEFVRSPSVLANANLLQMEATTDGRRVIVSESAHIMEKSPDASYVWAVRVYRDGRKLPGQPVRPLSERLLSEHYYLDQVFKVPAASMQMTPTFKDSFALEPGVYHVQVTLHRVRPNFDARQLTPQTMKQFKSRVGGIQRVVVTD